MDGCETAMTRVHILSTHRPAASLILTPLFVNRRLLGDLGITVRVFRYGENGLYDADCVIFDGRVYRRWDRAISERRAIALLEDLNKRGMRVFWFDTTDSTGTTQFQFLPYVERYLKIQILRDKRGYLDRPYGGRLFTEYYHTRFGVNDSKEYKLPVPATASDLDKIQVSWGHSLADYGRWASLLRTVRRFIPLPAFYSQRFTEPGDRHLKASFRFGTTHGRETVAFQRTLIRRVAADIGFDTAKVSRPAYLRELRSCKVAVSPFGWGEPSYKDFEIIVNGAALIKPDMSHFATWPDLYVAGETYLPFKWDCSDLEEVLEDALEGDKWRRIATRAQETYRKYLFEPEGRREFCERFREIVSVRTSPVAAE